jgi:hypothetical protein
MSTTLTKPQRYTAEQVADALIATKGMVTLAARKLGCAPSTVRAYVTRYPSVAQAIREAREGFLDATELKLQQAVQNGEGWAIAFTLRTIGRHRGYVERTEVDQQVTVYTVDIDSSDSTTK